MTKGQRHIERRDVNLTRSAFLKGGLAATLLPAFADGSGKPNLRFGFISDIHIHKSRESADRVYKPALEWFRAQGVEAVVCTGDLATTGLLSELKHVSDVWYEVFPDDRLPDGRHVEKVFLYGNHDTSPAVARSAERHGLGDEFRRETLQLDSAKAWETNFREKFEPIYIKRVKGYTFVAAHWEGTSPEVTGVPEFLKDHAAELAGDRPFFYCQHAALRDTVNPLSPGHFDEGKAAEALKGFPNAFALTGHSHSALTDETSIWQGEFTALCGAACVNSGRRYARPWFENSDIPGSPEGPYPNRKGSQMPELNTYRNGGQGLLVDVFDDRIVLQRHSFVFNEPIGPDWVVPLPLGREKPFSIEARRKASTPPEFAPGDAIRLAERDGENREKKPTRQLVVSFPAASRGDRPFGYEVTVASDEPGVKPMVKCILSPDFNLPPSRRVTKTKCVFALAGLPSQAHSRVSVRAFNSFQRYGAPLQLIKP